MSMITLCNIALAKTDEEKAEAERIHREDVKNKPSDAEVITEFLSNCSTNSGDSVLNKGEFADLENGKITIKNQIN